MMHKSVFILPLLILFPLFAGAKGYASDSAAAAQILKDFLGLFADKNGTSAMHSEEDLYRTAAPYIVSRGGDGSRKWKDVCSYTNPGDRVQITSLCGRVAGIVYEAAVYRIEGYDTQMESEGQWHGLTVSFTKGTAEKRFIFAFLKTGGRYAPGDIDAVH